jgi:hypothetical protein
MINQPAASRGARRMAGCITTLLADHKSIFEGWAVCAHATRLGGTEA